MRLWQLYSVSSISMNTSMALNESKTTPPMASARLQRRSLLLGAYQYHIQYKDGPDMPVQTHSVIYLSLLAKLKYRYHWRLLN